MFFPFCAVGYPRCVLCSGLSSIFVLFPVCPFLSASFQTAAFVFGRGVSAVFLCTSQVNVCRSCVVVCLPVLVFALVIRGLVVMMMTATVVRLRIRWLVGSRSLVWVSEVISFSLEYRNVVSSIWVGLLQGVAMTVVIWGVSRLWVEVLTGWGVGGSELAVFRVIVTVGIACW